MEKNIMKMDVKYIPGRIDVHNFNNGIEWWYYVITLSKCK